MAAKELKPIATTELFNNQIKELQEIKVDLNQLKTDLLTAQKKYEQRLSEYELKLVETYKQIEQIQQEQVEKETNLLNATSEWLAVKCRLEKTVMSSKQKLTLNVGGEYYETTLETLTKSSEKTISYFQSLFSQQWQLEKDPKDGSIFIDRDGILFGYILQYLRTGQVAIDLDNVLLRRDLITEAEFYQIDSLVHILKTDLGEKSLFSNTKLLSTVFQIQLNKFFGDNNQQWQLIYRASRDGYTANLFHQFCNQQGPTMTVIRTQNGCIFGGFTTIPWSSSNSDKADSAAFLFTLKNPFGIPPTKYPIRERAVEFAVSHRSAGGPTFGSIQNGGSDIFLHSPFNLVGSRIFFPRTYKDTTGRGAITFTGDFYFQCDDIEVFTVRIN